MTQQLALTVFFLAVLLPKFPLMAEENMRLHGSLIEPPSCSISDGETIDIDFGDRLGVNKIDGVNYMMPVNYTITCEADAGARDMSLTVNGTVTSFDKAAVQTNKEQLGIRLLLSGKPFTLDAPISVDPKRLPVLEAVPVQQPGGKALSEGAFEATATLQADYQ